MPDSVQELGMMLGKSMKEQSTIKENMNPDEFDQQLVTFNSEQLVIEVVPSAENKCYDQDIFILDHPVYGELDSATLQLDGGYTTCVGTGSTVPGRVGVFGF